MKSNVCVIGKDAEELRQVLVETEKIASYNGLDAKQTLHLRLLAEELNGILSELLKNFSGSFWIENDGPHYELHVQVETSKMSREVKDSLLAVSTSRKNARSSGIMGRILDAAENMFLFSEAPSSDQSDESPFYDHIWTLEQYRAHIAENKKSEEWDEMESSIVGKIADDVIVGVRGKNVEIIIKKTV